MHSDLMSPTTGRVWIGRLTDGRTARSVEVDVVVRPDGLVLSGRHADHPPAIWIYDGLASNVPLHGALGEVVVTPRAMPGATLTVADHDFVRALRAAAPHLGVKAARLGGMRPGLAVGAAVFMTTAIVFALDLSPSKGIASLMPMKARDMLGERVLMSLPSRKVGDASAGQSALRALVQRLAPGRGSWPRAVTVQHDRKHEAAPRKVRYPSRQSMHIA